MHRLVLGGKIWNKRAEEMNARFGEWEQVAKVKDVYGDVLFTAPSVAVNVAHPLLAEMNKELKTDGRKFTFLCGHDSNIASVLAALDVEEYELPNSIEKRLWTIRRKFSRCILKACSKMLMVCTCSRMCSSASSRLLMPMTSCRRIKQGSRLLN